MLLYIKDYRKFSLSVVFQLFCFVFVSAGFSLGPSAHFIKRSMHSSIANWHSAPVFRIPLTVKCLQRIGERVKWARHYQLKYEDICYSDH